MTSTTAFSARTVPWAFTGATAIDEPVSLDEALHHAHLDFEIELRDVAYRTAQGNWKPQAGRAAVVRKDTDVALGGVSKSYVPMPYREAFSVLGDLNPEIVAAGSHNDGRQAFMVVQDPLCRTVEGYGNDPHDLYIVMRTSHDATRGHEISLLPLRGRCMNMMPMAFGLHGAKQRWTIRHSGQAEARLTEAGRILSGLSQYAEEFQGLSARLAAIDLELDEARGVLDEVVPAELKSREKRIDALLDTYQHSEVNGFTGTGWGLVNAVTEFFDHRDSSRSQNEAARWLRGLDGVTRTAANRTAELLLNR